MSLGSDGADARHYFSAPEFPARLRLVRWLGHQKWIPKGQDRLLRMLLHPETCAPFLFEVDFFGKKYRGDLAQFYDWLVFCYGCAAANELTLMEAVAAELRKTRTGPLQFVDVGGNVGHHALFMSGIAERVLTFEPFPPLQALIRQKIALNNLTNVRLVPAGLGENEETLDYFPSGTRNSGTGSFLPVAGTNDEKSFKLQIRRGDAVLDELGIGRVDFVKVDVEGYELFVFRGMRNRIMKDRPVILTEISDRSRDQLGSEKNLRALFYEGAQFAEVTGRLGHRFTLRPFHYETAGEVLIVPPELGGFLAAQG